MFTLIECKCYNFSDVHVAFCMVKIVTWYVKHYESRNAKFSTARLLPMDFPGIFSPLVVYMYVILCMNFYMIFGFILSS